jgi:hypothetical protein
MSRGDYSFSLKDNDDILSCRHCNWSGKRRQAKQQRFISDENSWRNLAGRDGWIWKCPDCGTRVDEDWLRMS